jgi:hypothetical protein
MVPAWLITLASGALGAFVAAWAGAYVGFRRGKKERALDRRIGWHEAAIQGLAQYEESLERLRGHALNVLVVQRTKNRPANAAPPRAEDMPRTIKAPATLWTELAASENRARALRRLLFWPLGVMLAGVFAGIAVYAAIAPAMALLDYLNGKPRESLAEMLGIATACGMIIGRPVGIAWRWSGPGSKHAPRRRRAAV